MDGLGEGKRGGGGARGVQVKPDFLEAACTRPAALAAIIKLVNLMVEAKKRMYSVSERKNGERECNESQPHGLNGARTTE